MADIDLPVFASVPNWSRPVVETLEWLTDVQRSMMGFEQRTALRETPRRSFRAVFNPRDEERSFVALWMQRFAEQTFLQPLWHDRAKLTGEAAAGALRLDFDNTFREFETGGLALIRRDSFTYEVVQIEAQDEDGIDIDFPLARDWPAGASVYPLRVARLSDPQNAIEAIVSSVGEATLDFTCQRANPYPLGAETLMLHDGIPVLADEPNRGRSLRQQYERLFEDADFGKGLVYRRDEAGRAFATSFYDWWAVGREASHRLRQTLYRLNGRQKAVWLPTFNQDIVLARPLTSGQTRLNVRRCGYRLLGGPTPGRDHVILRDSNGVRRILRITGTENPLAPDEDRLILSAAVNFAAPEGRSGSFIEQTRLAQDTVEITHHADTDGLTEAAAAFRAFAPGRTTAGPLVVPFPEAEMTQGACGVPAELNPCIPPVFDGWYVEWVLDYTRPSNGRAPGWLLYSGRRTGDRTIVSADGRRWPDGPIVSWDTEAGRVVVRDRNPESYPVMERGILIQFQFNSFTASQFPAFLRVQMRRWDDPAGEYTQLVGKPQSTEIAPGLWSNGTGAALPVGNLWPFDFFMDF